MNNYLVDTTVIIDHLRGSRKAAVFLEEFNPQISIVTIAELIQGAQNKQEQASSIKLCENFQTLTLNGKISSIAIELMKKFYLPHGIRLLDALIAATALENKLVLITNNLKHFRFIKGLEVQSQKEAFAKVL